MAKTPCLSIKGSLLANLGTVGIWAPISSLENQGTVGISAPISALADLGTVGIWTPISVSGQPFDFGLVI